MMRTGWILIAALTAWSGAAFAQNAPTKNANPNVVTLSRGTTVEAAVTAAAKTGNVLAFVDPAVVGNVSAAVARQPLEQMLASIAASQKVEWRKVYLTDVEIPRRPDGGVDVPKLKNMVEAASLAPTATIGVIDPKTGQIAITTRTAVTTPETQEWLKTRRPVYVLYRPSILGSADPVSDYLTVQKNSMDAFVKMTPEQRSAAMKQGIEMFLNTDPQVMGQMMQQQMQAFMDLPPETKQKLMEASMRMMGGAFGDGGNMPPPPPPPPPGQ